MRGIRLVIFDWNGTLQDDVSLYFEYSVRRTFARYGLESPSLDEYRAEIPNLQIIETLEGVFDCL